jgi:DNA (cytosine-5)-methyltransferase 1
MGGKHAGNNDSRDMFPFAARAVSNLHPKAFIFENVKGLLRESFSGYFNYIIKRLTFPSVIATEGESWEGHFRRLNKINFYNHQGLKYKVMHKLINAADFGVPQVRERVVIVGIRSDLDNDWNFPPQSHPRAALEQSLYVTGEYWKKHRINSDLKNRIMDHAENRNRSAIVQPNFISDYCAPWVTVRDAIGDLPDPLSSHGYLDHRFQGGAKPYTGHTGSDFDWPSKTIKAGGHGVPGGENMIRLLDGSHRYYTVLEAKRIQTFPDDYIVTGAWGEAMRQIGNAVPVLLGKKIGESVIAHISDVQKRAAI